MIINFNEIEAAGIRVVELAGGVFELVGNEEIPNEVREAINALYTFAERQGMDTRDSEPLIGGLLKEIIDTGMWTAIREIHRDMEGDEGRRKGEGKTKRRG